MDPVFEKLVKLMPPPQDPHGATGNWDEAEAELGTPFPDDYKLFIGTYGVGLVCDFLWIYSPFSSEVNLFRDMERVVKTRERPHHRLGIRVEPRDEVPIGAVACGEPPGVRPETDQPTWILDGLASVHRDGSIRVRPPVHGRPTR